MITDAAVEAGAVSLNSRYALPWEALPPWVQQDMRDQARLVLVAAEPHQQTPPVEPAASCPTRLMDGRNELRCWLPLGHEGDCR